jgi:hypothetical protein
VLSLPQLTLLFAGARFDELIVGRQLKTKSKNSCIANQTHAHFAHSIEQKKAG